MIDYSFIRFKDTLSDALDLGNSKLSEFNYDMQIHLSPHENYSIITNTNNGIAFDNNYKAFLIDVCGNILSEITDNILINEFTHNESGLQQCKIEILALNLDYYTDLVCIMLNHNITNGKSYYSNPFLLSEYDLDETIRFDFRNYSNLDNTCYKIANIYQSIRLKGIFQKNSFTSTSESYVSNGVSVTSKLVKLKQKSYILDMVNDFIYDRIQYLLSHDVIYLDNIRVTNKQTYENEDKLSNSANISRNTLKVYINENDVYVYKPQIFEYFDIISKIPSGNITLNNYNSITNNSTVFEIEYNKNITEVLANAELKVFKDSALFGIVSVNKFSKDSNKLYIDISELNINSTGVYRCELNSCIKSNTEVHIGIYESNWTFKIGNADYNSSDYNSNDYNT